ncbi:response regulator [Mariniphaga sediminis]|jgi:DNA-binding NtrC family response regulator|uniref:Response regulator n=1 Tax=Mariniphaga sediminis TaxID=1628158 RepID=A0A399D8H7_9BACT|nr:response regulator [Mariniphaga sediminis]RIH66762.1 response regulator [Mariniphaga sediminis]
MAEKKSNLIYVVEDNEVYNKLVTEFLKNQNYTHVKSFFSGEECVKTIENGEKPDIIIQDYFLEKMTGMDVFLKVRKISPKSEFIFLTNNESMEVAVNTIKFGAYDYIIKDKITLDKVMDRIRKISRTKNLERKNKQIQLSIILFLTIVFLIVLFAVLYFVVFGAS